MNLPMSGTFVLNKYKKKLQLKILKYFNNNYSCSKIALKLILFNIKYLFNRAAYSKSFYKDNICHILLKPSAGVGDHFHFLKYCYALKRKFGDKIEINIFLKKEDLFLKDSLYAGADFINKVFYENAPRHDLEISLVRFPEVAGCDFKRLIHINNRELNYYVQKICEFYTEYSECFNSDLLGRIYSQIHERTREDQPDVFNLLNMKNISDFSVEINPAAEKTILTKFSLNECKFIILQTGGEACFKAGWNDQRQWPLKYYEKLVKLLKEKYPHVKIIQCGKAGQPEIANTDVCLLGKTSFNELLVLLKNANLLISQEGGYPIIRHYISHKKSCVLFGPTDKMFFGFMENINLSAAVCPGCEWLSSKWYLKCIKTGGAGVCMPSIKPEMIINKTGDL